MIELKSYNERQYASATELHEALGIKKVFSQWMTYNIQRAELEEEEDFLPILLESTGGRPKRDYYLTEQAAIGLIMMSGGTDAKKIRKLVIDAFQEKQKGLSFDHKEINALMDLSRAMMLISMQKKVESKHYKIYTGDENWWIYRARILGYSKKDIEKAMIKMNKKHDSTRKSLLKLDADELIRTGVIDFFMALGKSEEYAKNAGEICKDISQNMDFGINIWDDTKDNPLGLDKSLVEKAKLSANRLQLKS